MTEDEECAKLKDEYQAHMHGVQTGIAAKMNRINVLTGRTMREPSTEPKHLRVGINSAMVNNAAIADLLIEKGVFTKVEYYRQMVKFAKLEKETYEEELGVTLG